MTDWQLISKQAKLFSVFQFLNFPQKKSFLLIFVKLENLHSVFVDCRGAKKMRL